jgi:hypothetical protein
LIFQSLEPLALPHPPKEMNGDMEVANTSERSVTSNAIRAMRDYLRGHRGWMVLALAVLGAAVFFSWGWLVTLGVAPVLVALAPCAAMCALGLCTNKTAGTSCTPASKAVESSDQRE